MAKFELYSFQKDAVIASRNKFKKGKKKLILCSPTGSGKTVMGCWMVAEALERGKVVTVLVDRKEILDQFGRALTEFGLMYETVTAGSNPLRCNLYLGMVESYYRRCKTHGFLLDSDLFIFDEAHSTSYFKLIDQLNDKFVMGLTATPVLTNTKSRLNEYYQDIVELAKVEHLIKHGFLCDSVTYSGDFIDLKKLKKKNGDFTEESQSEQFSKSQVISGLAESYKRICDGAKFICYNVNVKHSKETCGYFNMMGIKSRHVDGESDPDYRKETFHMLKTGAIQGVHNFGICTTGFDEPGVQCIIQNFATDSLSKHIQTAGRGSRIHHTKKSKFIILDMGMNYSRHGLWNTNKDWSDIFFNPSEASEKERKDAEDASNVCCSTCGNVFNTLDTKQCPICGTDAVISIQNRTKDKEPTKAELKIIKAQLESQLPPDLQNRSIDSMSRSELIRYAEHMNYDSKWVYVRLGLRSQYRGRGRYG